MAATLLLASVSGLVFTVSSSAPVHSLVAAQDTEVPIEPPAVEPPPTDTPVELPPTDTPTIVIPPTDTPTIEPTNTSTVEPPTETPTVEPPTKTPSPSISPSPLASPTIRSADGPPTTNSPSTRTATSTPRSNDPTDPNDPDYYLGRVDAWLTSEIRAGDTLRTDMANPQFEDAAWYIDQTSAVGLILTIDEELQELNQTNPDLDDVHQQVLTASSDQATAAGDCDVALVSSDIDDAADCQAAIETSTGTLQDLRDALADWDGSDGDLVESSDRRPQRSTVEPTVEPTPTSERVPRGGASTSAAERPTATAATDTESTEEPNVVLETGSGETRDAPLGVGETGVVGDYEITVLSVIPNADDVVAAENQFNDLPGAGEQFFIARVSVTYTGSETGNPAFDLDFQSVGDSSTSYTTYTNSCGVIPDDPLLTVAELFEGGAAEFNVCWAIDSGDADSLEMYVEPLFDFDSDRVWFSLDDSN